MSYLTSFLFTVLAGLLAVQPVHGYLALPPVFSASGPWFWLGCLVIALLVRMSTCLLTASALLLTELLMHPPIEDGFCLGLMFGVIACAALGLLAAHAEN